MDDGQEFNSTISPLLAESRHIDMAFVAQTFAYSEFLHTKNPPPDPVYVTLRDPYPEFCLLEIKKAYPL